ncbi:glycine--tRNA ligase subunit beta, partial [Corynebacterium sp. UMB8791]
ESKDPQQIISGNEKVVRPRLADAEFFFNTDRKKRLEDNLPRLQTVLFQQQLGTPVQESQGSDANGSSTGSATSASSNSARTGFNMGPTGVDVSKWQRPGGVALKWDEVAASGQKFAFIKATDGVEGDQKYFPVYANDGKLLPNFIFVAN